MQLTRPTKSRVFGIRRTFATAGAYPKTGRSRVPNRSFALLLCVFASGALSGCALWQPHADPTRFYVLTVPSAPPERAADGESNRWKVGLRPVEVPAYLRSRAMVVRTGTHEIHFAEFDRWAEPLDQGISRVLKESLSSARNVESVALNSHGDDTLDYEVAIRVLACEGVRVENETSAIRFAVTWEARSVEKNSTEIRRGVFTADPVAWNGKDYGQLAERLSEAIAGASQAVAADLPMEAKTPGKTTVEKTKLVPRL
jgi:uncharacterized lipoprotein YmbA